MVRGGMRDYLVRTVRPINYDVKAKFFSYQFKRYHYKTFFCNCNKYLKYIKLKGKNICYFFTNSFRDFSPWSFGTMPLILVNSIGCQDGTLG